MTGIAPQATTRDPALIVMACSPSAMSMKETGLPWKTARAVALALPAAVAFVETVAAKLALGFAQVPACRVARTIAFGARRYSVRVTRVPSFLAETRAEPLTCEPLPDGLLPSSLIL